MNREQLREKILEHSNSMFPLIDFFNDIGRNKDAKYDKERAYEDIEKIYDVFMYYREKSEKLEKENKELKNTILSLELDTCIPELRKENAKLKNVIEIFKGFSLGLTMYGGSETSYGLDVNNSIILTKEEYEINQTYQC